MYNKQTHNNNNNHNNNHGTANLPTNIVGFGGLDSSIILIYRGGIPTSIGNFPESLSRAMLVGTMLVGRLGVALLFELAQGLQSLLFFVLHQNISRFLNLTSKL